jgi:two-component system, chemotaxis family, sensor kinase CheA
MSAEIDLSQYLDLFLQEADEQLATLEQETLKLEAEPTVDRLNTIFRAAHTLKGSSRAMGFNNLASLTHEMENLLDSLRCGKLSVTTDIADALLKCLDTLSEMKDDIAAGNSEKIDTSELVQHLISLQEISAAIEAATPAVTLATDVMEALYDTARLKPVYCTKFRLRADCMMKFARAFMAVSVIQDGGELLASIPDPESLEEERFDLDFELYFEHPQSEAFLKTRFEGISEVE